MIARLRKLLRSDRGAVSLPEVMVGVLVSAVSMSVIAGGTIAMSALNQTVSGTATASVQTQNVEDRWISGVTTATRIEIVDGRTVKLFNDANCVESDWSVVASAQKTGTFDTTVTTEPITGCGSASGTDGAPAQPSTTTLLYSQDETASFTFQNAVGRPITFLAGNATDAAGTQPSTATSAQWNSTAVSILTLNGIVMAGTSWSGEVSINARVENAGGWVGTRTREATAPGATS